MQWSLPPDLLRHGRKYSPVGDHTSPTYTFVRPKLTRRAIESTMEDIGLSRHPPSPAGIKASKREWNYTSLKNPPNTHEDSDQWSSSIYRGIVPAKSILRRDIAVNGSIVSKNKRFAHIPDENMLDLTILLS
jgi:hypothetical protein